MATSAQRSISWTVDAGTGALLTWHPSANTTLAVETLAAGGGALTVGGEFTKVGGVAQQHFAEFK